MDLGGRAGGRTTLSFFDQDPAPGSPKFCECCSTCAAVIAGRQRGGRGVAGPAETPNVIAPGGNIDGGFTPCADEHERCECSGTVRYRAWDDTVGHVAESPVPPGTTSMLCENGQFGGDPAPGKAKRCLCRPQSPNVDTVEARPSPAPAVNQHEDVGKEGGRSDDWHRCSAEYGKHETLKMTTLRYCSCPLALSQPLLP